MDRSILQKQLQVEQLDNDAMTVCISLNNWSIITHTYSPEHRLPTDGSDDRTRHRACQLVAP